MSLISNPKLKKTITKLFNEIELIRRTPRFPYSEGPREYQINAYNSWVEPITTKECLQWLRVQAKRLPRSTVC
jgi:hypothetical protein